MNLKNYVICNIKKPSNHCLIVCPHGRPHKIDRWAEVNCFEESELCNLSDNKRRVRIQCRKLTKKEIQKFIK